MVIAPLDLIFILSTVVLYHIPEQTNTIEGRVLKIKTLMLFKICAQFFNAAFIHPDRLKFVSIKCDVFKLFEGSVCAWVDQLSRKIRTILPQPKDEEKRKKN